MTVHALLIGIDAYEERPLRGAVNDVEAVEDFLLGRVERPRVELLCDEDATRAAVIGAIRAHLGQAGPGDVGLLWFSGHGGEEPVPDGWWAREPGGYQQSLVCVDTRLSGPSATRRPGLLDRELEVLLGAVAVRGVHVVAVIDCCHAAGVTRDLPSAVERRMGRALVSLPVTAYLPEAFSGPAGEHFLLAACRSHERAVEVLAGAAVHGVFTHALLTALRTLEPTATYRELLAAAGCVVRGLTHVQAPMLVPAEEGPGDVPFLGGQVRRPARFRLARGPHGWEVDAGRCHGVVATGPGVRARFAVPSGPRTSRLLDVVSVGATTSRVEPVGWVPDPHRTHAVVLAAGSAPLFPVQVEGTGDAAQALERVRAAIARAGPGRGPSAELQVVDGGEPAPLLRVRATRSGGLPVLRTEGPDGLPVVADVVVVVVVVVDDDDAAARAVAQLEHIARWTRIQRLENPLSALGGAVRVEVVPWRAGDTTIPRGRPALRADAGGDIRLEYRFVDGRWVPPRVFVRLRNTTDRALWCLLCDLTQRWAASTALFPCDRVGPGRDAAALRGGPIDVTFPAGTPIRPGAHYRDWLKLVVADEQFSDLAFHLPALGAPPPRESRLRSADGGQSGDWTTAIVPVVVSCGAP